MDKWETLKKWIMKRHDQMEALYKETNFGADASQLGAFREVFQTMNDLDLREIAQRKRALNKDQEKRV